MTPRASSEQSRPDDVYIPSIDVCAWCGDSECDGTHYWDGLDANDDDDMTELEELQALIREGKAWRIIWTHGLAVAEQALAYAENRDARGAPSCTSPEADRG